MGFIYFPSLYKLTTIFFKIRVITLIKIAIKNASIQPLITNELPKNNPVNLRIIKLTIGYKIPKEAIVTGSVKKISIGLIDALKMLINKLASIAYKKFST
jgi:hypothetical protein